MFLFPSFRGLFLWNGDGGHPIGLSDHHLMESPLQEMRTQEETEGIVKNNESDDEVELDEVGFERHTGDIQVPVIKTRGGVIFSHW